jgi:hypothetical protein
VSTGRHEKRSASALHVSNTGVVDGCGSAYPLRVGWSPGQRILNDAGARLPEHALDPPAPVTARIVWQDDGEEYLETEAAGWSGQPAYVPGN